MLSKTLKSIFNIFILLILIWVVLFFIIPWEDYNQEEIKKAREEYENIQNNN